MWREGGHEGGVDRMETNLLRGEDLDTKLSPLESTLNLLATDVVDEENEE